MLQVAGIDGSGGYCTVTWNIKREHADATPTLELHDSSDGEFLKEAYYLLPARRALEKVCQSKSQNI